MRGGDEGRGGEVRGEGGGVRGDWGDWGDWGGWGVLGRMGEREKGEGRRLNALQFAVVYLNISHP